MSGFSMGCGLRARVLVKAAPVDGLGAEVEAALDLDAVDIEAIASLDVGTLLALEIGVLDCIDLVWIGGQIPGGLAGRVEPGLADGCQRADWSCHAFVPVSELIYAAFRSNAKGLLPPSDECLRLGL